MAKVYTGKIAIPGNKIEEYLKLVGKDLTCGHFMVPYSDRR